MNKYILLCLVFTLFGAVGGYFFKKASSANSILRIAASPYLYLGGTCYLIGAVLNIVALRALNYTIVLPLTSITYIWTLILSYFALKEKITRKKLAGVFLIILGAAMLAIV